MNATPAPQADVEMCERAVEAIYESLDGRELVNASGRARVAGLLEPLDAMPLQGRSPRLIQTLRLPDPIDASDLYWLTRRLVTLVPDLQAVSRAAGRNWRIPRWK